MGYPRACHRLAREKWTAKRTVSVRLGRVVGAAPDRLGGGAFEVHVQGRVGVDREPHGLALSSRQPTKNSAVLPGACSLPWGGRSEEVAIMGKRRQHQESF